MDLPCSSIISSRLFCINFLLIAIILSKYLAYCQVCRTVHSDSKICFHSHKRYFTGNPAVCFLCVILFFLTLLILYFIYWSMILECCYIFKFLGSRFDMVQDIMEKHNALKVFQKEFHRFIIITEFLLDWEIPHFKFRSWNVFHVSHIQNNLGAQVYGIIQGIHKVAFTLWIHLHAHSCSSLFRENSACWRHIWELILEEYWLEYVWIENLKVGLTFVGISDMKWCCHDVRY